MINKNDTVVDTIDPDLKILLSIIYSFDVINRYINTELKKYDSRPIRAIVLNTIRSHDGRITPMELSKELFRAPNSVTSILNTLEKDGLVKRIPNELDARSVDITLTEDGLEAAKKLTTIMSDISKKMLPVLTERQTRSVRRNLKNIRQYLLESLDHYSYLK